MEQFEKTVTHYAPWMRKMSEVCVESSTIDPSLYQKYNVKRGLRDVDGTGVVAGLTEISEINAYKLDENGNRVECPGELYYRGIPIRDLVDLRRPPISSSSASSPMKNSSGTSTRCWATTAGSRRALSGTSS